MNNQLLVNEKDAETVFNFDVGNWPFSIFTAKVI